MDITVIMDTNGEYAMDIMERKDIMNILEILEVMEIMASSSLALGLMALSMP
jgi:hypothetical protein